MGEPERRRRRLRPPSSAAAPVEATPAETPAAAPGSEAVTAAPIPAVPMPAVPIPAAVLTPAVIEDPAPVEDDAPLSARAGFAGRPQRVPGSRPTSGAGAGDDREGERGLRGLVGSGSSQVSVGAAMRARDAARPTDAHLAEAEETLAIVRRNWLPREDLPRNR